ncbi:DUF551 domain-containing protein [Enterobacter kobei]|uniref:DUF551 domain-containing protein n=1 Tax=Enterobacter kobei TaxID=208224 RepID=UPI00210A6535|nr:DUF551 domain-containing protein [Enterobacter kobei]MCQ4418437.1 DUF551 domain-containing protein [Enterobacter kobei]HDC4269648.1 DUF551 domain-containing protein [Enterobacter kobei]
MSTITREQQKQILIDTANHVINRDNTSPHSENMRELARIALASLEAEPVAYMTYKGYLLHAADPKLAEYSEPTPLYDAPPAPVSVPDEVTTEDCPAFVKYDVTDVDEAWSRGFNACRAAMLQGAEPVTTAYKLPDGWVACSVRMPNDEEDVLCFGQYGDNDIDEERYQFMGWLSRKGIKRVWRVSDGDSQNRRARVTHWMPLPAAPQQEDKNV